MVESDQLERLSGIILDLDDTIYLEAEYVKSGFQAVADSLSNDLEERCHYGAWLLRTSLERKDSRTFNHLLDTFPVLSQRSQVAQMVQIYREHQPSLTLSPLWREALEGWRQEGIFLGLISDGDLTGQQRKVEALGLRHLLDHIILTDQYGREHWKPARTAFEEMQERSGLQRRQLVYVGDNVLKDFVAPNQLGWRSVRFRSSGQVRGDLMPADRQFAAEAEATDLSSLRVLLEKWR